MVFASPLNVINGYLDWLSELDNDEGVRLVKLLSGGVFGWCCPLTWDFRRPARKWTLVKTCVITFIITSYFILAVVTSIKSFDVGIDMFCAFFCLILYAFYALLAFPLNFVMRRSIIPVVYDYLNPFTYADFPDNTENEIRGKLNRLCQIIRNVYLIIYSSGFLVPLFFYLDNIWRNEESLPDWFDKRLPVPLWLPFRTTDPIPFTIVVIYLMLVTVIICQGIFALANLNYNFCFFVIIELEVLHQALYQQEKRSLKTYSDLLTANYNGIAPQSSHSCIPDYKKILLTLKEIKSSESNSRDDTQGHRSNTLKTLKQHDVYNKLFMLSEDKHILQLIHLYENKHFSKCYHDCFLKTIHHHKNIVRTHKAYLSIASFAYSVILQTSGLLLATNLYSVFEFSEIKTAIYSTQWINADERIKKILRIFHLRAFRPEELRSNFSRNSLNFRFLFSMTQICYSFVNLLLLIKRSSFKD